MKIEIDFSRPDELRKQKRELEMALTTIETALVAIGNIGREKGQQSFPGIPDKSPAPITSSDDKVAPIIAALPDQFTMREAKMAADEAKIPDSRLRREMSRMTESGALVMVQKGQGRRPATFRKA